MGGLVDWREWSTEAFADAKAQDKLVLLDIGAVWCHWCHVMDDGIPGDPVHRGTYSDPEVLALIEEHFIPIKVDNDRRPDINARYNMGGWPTTAFLTPEGDTLYGRTYVPPNEMRDLLEYIAGLYSTERGQIDQQTVQMRADRTASEQDETLPGDLDASIVSGVLETIKRSFDFVYGGFGKQPKFPHPAVLALVLEQFAATGDVELKVIAEKTLRGMDSGGMYDRYAGGFFRYSTTRDWSIPHFEKMLEDNAKLTDAYALAAVVLADDSSMETVRSAHRWLLTDMFDAQTKTFAGSQDADEEERYYGKPLDVRATMPTPYIDRTVYTNWNALTVSSLARRYMLTGETEVLTAARDTFAFLVREMSIPGESGALSLRHYFVDGRAEGGPGLIGDQVDFVAAALDLYEATGDRPYLGAAGFAARFLIDVLEDNDGGFFDVPASTDAIGELATPKKAMNENADASLALIRLSAFTGDPTYRQSAARALSLFAGSYTRYGYFAAQYARAVDALLAPPLHIVIAGEAGGLDLQRVAWKAVATGKTVQSGIVDGYPAGPDGSARAYVCVGETCLAPASTPDELRERIFQAFEQRG